MPDRAVFDCMLFLQAATHETNPAFRCFQFAEAGRVQLQLSPAILDEVDDVLNRPELRRKFSALTPARVARFLKRTLAHSAMNPEPPGAFPLARDPDDEPYLSLAIHTGARYLVTRDKDLLDLMNQESPDGREFCKRFPNLKILNPAAFLQAMSPPPT